MPSNLPAHLKALEDRITDLQKRLENPSMLLTAWGKLGVAASQKAFQDQAFGGEAWKERYPGMKPPFLNIAGTISDFNAGRSNPKPNRFQNRPALIDEGMRGGIWGSITFEVQGKDSVLWGTNKPYASVQMKGGTTTMPITGGAKERIANWLLKDEGKKTLLKDGKPVKGAGFLLPKKQKEGAFQPLTKPKSKLVRQGREGYVAKLWPMLKKDVLTTHVVARPFMGIPQDLADEMLKASDMFLNHGKAS